MDSTVSLAQTMPEPQPPRRYFARALARRAADLRRQHAYAELKRRAATRLRAARARSKRDKAQRAAARRQPTPSIHVPWDMRNMVRSTAAAKRPSSGRPASKWTPLRFYKLRSRLRRQARVSSCPVCGSHKGAR